jgi:plasmid segregation protein ParM
MEKLAIDVGYSSTKVKYNDKLYKIPSAISFATDLGIDYGDSSDTVKYKGETYYVGDAAVGLESFTTTDYQFKANFDPVIVYHVLKKLDLVQAALDKDIQLYLTLALTDWKYKDNYLEALASFQVDDLTIGFENISLLPQGAGVYMAYVSKVGEHPLNAAIIDVGYNTINYMVYENGQPQKAHSKGFAGHGVSSIIKSFSAYLENTFSMPFSEAEALKIFMNNKFIFSGVDRPDVVEKIQELKSQFVKRLFNSVLTSEKKLLATSEKVLLAGGGCYLLEGINFPPNVQFADKPYEFANIAQI